VGMSRSDCAPAPTSPVLLALGSFSTAAAMESVSCLVMNTETSYTQKMELQLVQRHVNDFYWAHILLKIPATTRCLVPSLESYEGQQRWCFFWYLGSSSF
jgi:hypothetical protein